MTSLGWVFLIVSISFVWGLTIWCFYQVLTLPPEEEAVIAQDMKDFHSA